MKLQLSLLAVATIVLGCSQPPKAAVPAQEPELGLTSVMLLTDDGGKPGTAIEKFDYRQKTLHFLVSLSRKVEKAQCKWIFIAKETSAGNGRQLQGLEGEVEGSDLSGQITATHNWPVGTYQVNVLIADKPVGSFEYEVTGEVTKIAFLGHSLAPDDGKGMPAGRVEAFRSPVKTLHLQVTTKGVDTTAPEVVWRLYKVAKGKDVELGNTVQPKTRLQDSVLKCQFDSPKPWEKGDYRADIFVAGKKAHSILFKVL